jgi:hypothetical protein
VQASVGKPDSGQKAGAIGMIKRDGTEILRGTASVNGDATMLLNPASIKDPYADYQREHDALYP